MARVTGIRSGPSRTASFLRFINCTPRKVSVIWLDYGGSAVHYGTLEPNRHFDIHTYEGHPWVSEDSKTKIRMLLNKVYVFYPTPVDDQDAANNVNNNNRESRCYLPLLSNNSAVSRLGDEAEGIDGLQFVYITLPVLTLLERAAETIATNVKSSHDIEALPLPKMLKSYVGIYHHPS